MLESSLFESQGRKKTKKPLTVVVSAVAHVVTVAVLALIPLLQTQALTIPPVDMSLFLPQMEKPRDVTVFSARPRAQGQTEVTAPVSFTAPAAIPREIAYVVDEPIKPDLPFMPSGDGAGLASVLAAFGNRPAAVPALEPAQPPPPPPPAPPVIDARPFRRGGDVQAANLIHEVKPIYPPLARQTRTQGAVILEAVISKEGSISSLRVISGHPLLTQAAMDAVKQWKYRPTMLNGAPVEVISTVTVTFTLQ